MKFNYLMPVRIISGEGCVLNNAEVLKGFGKKSLIVCGAHSAKANGSLDDVTAALSQNGQDYCVYDKVMSNPTISCVYEGAEFAKENGVDFVVAIGGGSPMDAAKAIALLAKQDIPQEKLFDASCFTDEILPMAFVPTTAGTGSEVTQYSILTNDAAQTKTSIAAPLMFPDVAFLDGKYMLGLGLRTTVNTAVDALSHSIEGMLSASASVITDTLAAKSIEMIGSCIPALQKGELTLEQRNILLEASTLAGMVIAQTGTTSVHVMGYSLTYFRGIDHGRANGLLLGETLRYIEQRAPALVKKAIYPLGFSKAEQLKDLLDELLGDKESISKDEIAQFAAKAYVNKNLKNGRIFPDKQGIIDIYTKSFASE